jgi:hypothetical protein
MYKGSRNLRSGREANHLPPPSDEVKNVWNYTAAPQYIFMAWYLVKHTDNFTFALRIINKFHHSNRAGSRKHKKNRKCTLLESFWWWTIELSMILDVAMARTTASWNNSWCKVSHWLTRFNVRGICYEPRNFTGWMIGGSSPGSGWEIFSSLQRPDLLWGPSSLLPNGY